jgi:hypothetical protein
VLGKSGNFDGVDVIEVILSHPVTAEYISGKIYRYFVRQELSADMNRQLGSLLRQANYEIAPLLETIFLSRDFYSAASTGTRIKPPVELVVSTYRKMGLKEVPGVPDFNEVTESLGQKLFYPPTVAGWAHGRSWITPGLLLARGNFVYDTVFPDINFLPPDRYPGMAYQMVPVAEKLALDLTTTATKPESKDVTDVDADGRPGRGLQHPACQLSRLVAGNPEDQADSTRDCAVRPLGNDPGCRMPHGA